MSAVPLAVLGHGVVVGEVPVGRGATTVTGRALAYEGTVTVRVVEDRGGSHTEVGNGLVTGAGDHMGEFSGEIPFMQHNSRHGWVVFTEESTVDCEPRPDHRRPGHVRRGQSADPRRRPRPQRAGHADRRRRDVGPGAAARGRLARGPTRSRHAHGLRPGDWRRAGRPGPHPPTGTETAPYADVVATSAGHDGTFTLVWEYGVGVLHDHLTRRRGGAGWARAEADLPNVHRD